jgi:H+/Cl- antiporter ClcA
VSAVGRRHTRLTADIVVTMVVALLVALSAGRIVVWMRWMVVWPDNDRIWWAAMPAVGAMLSLSILAKARATPSTVDAHAYGIVDGTLELRAAPARFLAFVSGVGVGAPLGAEAPLMYFGGSLGAAVARRLHRPERWLLLAAAAAAFGMAIDAPIAAALLASEVGRRGLPRRADVLPLSIGALAAWVARRLTGEPGGVLGTDLGFTTAQVVIGAVSIGAVAGLIGRGGRAAVRIAQRRRMSLEFRLIAVFVVLGTAVPLGWWAAGDAIFLGGGDRLRTWAVQGSQPAVLAATAVFALLVLTMVACGVVGGLVVPMLSVGALVGALVGRAWLPGVPYAACVGIGACCLLAAMHGATSTAIALAFASFGWSSSAWLTVAAVVLASVVAGRGSVSSVQLDPPAWSPARVAEIVSRRRGGRYVRS